jgi:hypothetical protein
LPSDWRARAIDAARQRLQQCVQSTDVSPIGCPQSSQFSQWVSGYGASPESVQWRLVGQPLANGVAVVSPSGPASSTGVVDVYGQYAMTLSVSQAGQAIRPTGEFSGGIADASMTWDGSSFQDVQFAQGPSSMLPSGVNVAPLTRPNPPTDAQVLAAVGSAMHDCVTIAFKPTDPTVPNCPQAGATDQWATSAQWSNANGTDPMVGALVNFDPSSGAFIVSGGFDMNLHYVVGGNPDGVNDGPHDEPSSGNYKATVVWDGTALHVVTIVSA